MDSPAITGGRAEPLNYVHLPGLDINCASVLAAVARLGGFLARNSDGDPGWQTLWRSRARLQDLCWGAVIAQEFG